MNQPNKRAVIIGAGMVGSTSAYALILKGVVNEIIMIDIAEELAAAQVMDLQHIKVRVGSYSDVRPNDIVIITCGAAQKKGQNRLELAQANVDIVNSVLDHLMAVAKPLYIILVTNPVDVITYFAVKKTNFPEGMVFGTGTSLDTARMRIMLGLKLGLNPSNIHAYILGEHGDSSFFAKSTATYAGLPIADKLKEKEINPKELEQEVRNAAYKIIQGKNAAYFGIGHVVSGLVDSLVNNSGQIFPVSTLLNGEYGLTDVCISLPVQLGHSGAKTRILPKLSASEIEKFKASASVIKTSIDTIKNNASRVKQNYFMEEYKVF